MVVLHVWKIYDKGIHTRQVMSLLKFTLSAILLLALLVTGLFGECPEIYQRFSLDHTYCLPDEKSCPKLWTGIYPETPEAIVNLHNDYRNKVALGQETNMPKAASMMQMKWDDELAAIAQKHAESCRLDHDCDFCRMSGAFPVGQVVAYQFTESWKTLSPPTYSWAPFVNFLRSQMKNFDRKQIDSYKPQMKEDKKRYDYFTQLIWDKTYFIGCGFAQFQKPGKIYNYYVCNYGPKGNIGGSKVYEKGEPCSKCPLNSKCSSLFSDGTTPYEGLCKILDPLKEPDIDLFREVKPTETFYCTFHDEPDCDYKVTGTKRFMETRLKDCYILRVTVDGGESATINFTNPIKSPTGGLTFTLILRRMPLKAGQSFSSEFSVRFIAKEGTDHTYVFDNPTDPESWSLFHEEKIGHVLRPDSEVKFSLTFKVPEGEPSQVLELKRVIGGSISDKFY